MAQRPLHHSRFRNLTLSLHGAMLAMLVAYCGGGGQAGAGERRRASTTGHAPRELGAGLAIALLVGCGGGSGGSPTAPASPLQVAGTWSGYEEVRDASPAGNCLADFFNSRQGAHGDYDVMIDQTGTMVTLEVDIRVPGSDDKAAYAGVVGSSTLTADETRSVPDYVLEECRPGLSVKAHHLSGHLSLSGSSTQMEGALTEHIDVTNVADGSSLGEATVNLLFRMSR